MSISQFPEKPDGDAPPPGKPRTRLEDEVLEILQRTDTPVSMSEHVRRKVAQERRERAQRWRNEALSLPSRLGAFSGIFGFAILGFLAFLVRDASPLLATILAVLSVIVLFLPVVDRYRNGPQSSSSKRWRGRDMDFSSRPPGSSGQPAWFEHLRDRFRRPPRI
jgi:hypothetical protein